jgi:membrane protease subunit (stomatin/prohibitin family)
VQKAIDDKSRMGLIDDLDSFMKLKAAMAMEKAAESQGEAGAGLGMGMGMLLPAMFAQNISPRGGDTEPANQVQKTTCSDCSQEIPGNARFCPICGHQQLLLVKCTNCGKNLTPKAQFCSQCGQETGKTPPNVICSSCSTENLAGALFCNHCGHRL